MGDLVTDAMRWAIENFTGEYVDFAFMPTGVIRQALTPESGNLTVYDAISVVPMGFWNFPYGPYWGWLLCGFYLYGHEIKTAIELGLAMMGDFFYQVSGVKFKYSPIQPPGDRVVGIEIQLQDVSWTTLDTSPTNNETYLIGLSLQAAILIPNIFAIYPMFAVEPKYGPVHGWPDNGTAIPLGNIPGDTVLINVSLPAPDCVGLNSFSI